MEKPPSSKPPEKPNHRNKLNIPEIKNLMSQVLSVKNTIIELTERLQSIQIKDWGFEQYNRLLQSYLSLPPKSSCVSKFRDLKAVINSIPPELITLDFDRNQIKEVLNSWINAYLLIIKQMQGVIWFIANKFNWSWYSDRTDRIQEWNIWLMRAIETFEPAKLNFFDYAYKLIQQDISQSERRNWRFFSVSYYHQRIIEAIALVEEWSDKVLSNEELAKKTWYTAGQIAENRGGVPSLISIWNEGDEEEDSIPLGFVESHEDNIIQFDFARKVVDQFDKVYRQDNVEIFKLRLWLETGTEQTFDQIWQIFGFSWENARQRYETALKQIRQAMKAQYWKNVLAA